MSLQVEYNFTVDVYKPKPLVIHAVQGDSMRSLVLTLQKDGAAYAPDSGLETGESVAGAVLADKRDGTKCAYTKASWQASGSKAVQKISSGKYRVYLDDQVFAAPGKTNIFVRFYIVKAGADIGKTLHTFAIVADVEPNKQSKIVSKDYTNLPSQEEMWAIAKRAVLYDNQTGFTDAEKKTARNNIHAPDSKLFANDFSESTTYSFGNYAIRNGTLYRYNDNTPSSGPWVSSKWVSATFASTLPGCVRATIPQTFTASQKYQARENIEAARRGYVVGKYSASSTYNVGDWVLVFDSSSNRDVIKECTTAITTPEAYNPEHWSTTNKSIANTIANILRQLADIPTPGEDDEGGDTPAIPQNAFVYCDYDIPAATTPATTVEITADNFYPQPTNVGDVVMGRNGMFAAVTELTYDQTDSSVLQTATVAGILARFPMRDNVSSAFAGQSTYQTPTAYLANQPAGRYLLQYGNDLYVADNELRNNKILSKITRFAGTGDVIEYVFVDGSKITQIDHSPFYQGLNLTDTQRVMVPDPQDGAFDAVNLGYLLSHKTPQMFFYLPPYEDAKINLNSLDWMNRGLLVFHNYASEIDSVVFPDITMVHSTLHVKQHDVLIEQSTGHVVRILHVPEDEDEYDEDLQGWVVTYQYIGNVLDISRPPQIFVFQPSADEEELPASGDEATLTLSNHMQDQLQPSVAPVIGDLLFDVYTNRIARITSTPDVEVGGYYTTTVLGVGQIVDNRIPAAPSADGTYTLTATVADGEVTYSWT